MATAAAVTSRLKLQNILFTTDFSPASKTALPYVLAFAKWYDAKVFVAHAIPPEPPLSVPLDLLSREDDPYWQGARHGFEKFLAEDPLREAKHEVVMEQGDLGQVMNHIIRTQNIDLVILGTHGRQGLKKFVLGSSAEQIFRQANCPVMTVGPHAAHEWVEFGAFKHVIFATDFSPASLHALPYALSMAQETDAQVTLLHLISLVPMEQQEEVRARALERLKTLLPPGSATWCEPRFSVRLEFASDGILREAEEQKADLIVMGVHRTPIPRTAAHLPWAIAYDVVCGARCPVLTVRG
jgi:nucleotide-binding universal stress UspA family protein